MQCHHVSGNEGQLKCSIPERRAKSEESDAHYEDMGEWQDATYNGQHKTATIAGYKL